MSNILNHNRKTIDFNLCTRDYWDFHLALSSPTLTKVEQSDCTAAYIDFSNSECVWFDEIRSIGRWAEAKCDGITFNNIGYTGVDNGLIYYQKDRITNEEFLNYFLNSTLTLEEGDDRLCLHKVHGNNMIFDYTNEITDVDGMQVAMLNGGFYQGFFKTPDCKYQTLPHIIENGWTISMSIKPSNLTNPKLTLNDVHPENKGMFFFIGTRAENKWWQKFTTDHDFKSCGGNDVDSEYVNFGDNKPCLNSGYVTKITSDDYEKYTDDLVFETGIIESIDDTHYFEDGFVDKEYTDDIDGLSDKYVTDEYIQKDVDIDPLMKLKTTEGYDVSQPNIIEYHTNNKFLLYHHGKDGLDIHSDVKDTDFILYDVKPPKTENYFTLFHHGKGGLTTDSTKGVFDAETKRYDVLKDLYQNAIGFRIDDDGKVGYRYLVKDCENGGIKVEEEYSKSGVVKTNEWSKIDVQFDRVNHNIMRILIFVDEKLKLISKELPMINLRPLDDIASKQEGVPYNISIGGGTQGLCDVVYVDFTQEPKFVLPLEEFFGGSFIGYIKDFCFSNCIINR